MNKTDNQPLNFGYGYNDTNSIAIIWCIDDVKSIRSDLNDEECLDVLGRADQKHDASMGISFDTLHFHANYLFPKKEISK